ncbi:MAG: hypothetical protein NXH91_13030 [Phyllobacteriaceae bacterium]|jgi:hypothetical protein|nr:hypothetical protein [Phyllobacteriaceae bacterium]
MDALFKGAERLMAMDDASWARHANPWSAYTRFAGSVPTFLALYSGHWIGWWALVPIAVMAVWTFANPRLWVPPATTTSWAARGVLGERAYLNRKTVPVPAEHVRFANLTTACAIAFMAVAIYGFIAGIFWTAFSGFFAAILAKTWFVDRMAWLWADIKDAHPVYAAWDRADWTASFNEKS